MQYNYGLLNQFRLNLGKGWILSSSAWYKPFVNSFVNQKQIKNMSTARERRLYPQDWQKDEKKTGVIRWREGTLKTGDGKEHKSVTVTEDNQLVLDMKRLYPDDVIAIARDMLVALDPQLQNSFNAETVDYLNKAIYSADRRALSRHGYQNPEERELKLPY